MREKRFNRGEENGFPRLQLSASGRTEERLAVERERIEAASPNGEIQTLFRDWRFHGRRRLCFVLLRLHPFRALAGENGRNQKKPTDE